MERILNEFLPNVLSRIVYEYLQFRGRVVRSIDLDGDIPWAIAFTQKHMALILNRCRSLQFFDLATSQREKHHAEARYINLDSITTTGQLVTLSRVGLIIHIYYICLFEGTEQTSEILLPEGEWTSMAAHGYEVLLQSSSTSSISIWNVLSRTHVRNIQLDHEVSSLFMRATPQGLLTSYRNQLRLFGWEDRKLIQEFTNRDPHNEWQGAAIWDHHTLITSNGAEFQVFSLLTGKLLTVCPHVLSDGVRPYAMSMSPGGELGVCIQNYAVVYFMI